MPIRGGYAKDVYVVSSGEMMSLYAANNIASAIRNFGKRGYAQLRGLILNAKNIENEREIVAKAVEEIGTQVVCYVPRSPEIQEAGKGNIAYLEAKLASLGEEGKGGDRSGRQGAGVAAGADHQTGKKRAKEGQRRDQG